MTAVQRTVEYEATHGRRNGSERNNESDEPFNPVVVVIRIHHFGD
jgi:hypothetical protein